MWLSDLSIKRPVFITMVILAVTVIGWMFYKSMPLDLFPDIAIPVVAVRTIYPGATPQEVESLVTKPIEEVVSSIGRVQSVRSTSAESVSLVVVEFQMEYPAKNAADDVRDRLATIKNSLPADAEDPDVLRYDPSSAPIMTVVFADSSNRMTLDVIRTLLDDTVVPRFERVPGVATVDVEGGLEREIHVDLDLDRLYGQSLAVQQVSAAIKAENFNIPGGRLIEGSREKLLRTAGQFTSVEQIGAVPVPNLRGGTVYLRDVAKISDEFKEVRTKSRLNGRDSVVATIYKQSGTNTVRVADEVKRELARVQNEHPDLDIALAVDQSTFTRESTDDVIVSLIIGGLLAGLVVLVFFRDLRNTIVTVAGLPVIVIASFGAMYVAGFSLNMITLLALSISIGMLIDDAIVVRENIFRHMEAGESPRKAASKGTAEIAMAVVATTFSIIAVFGPVAFTTGIAGRFLREFGLTVAIAVAISLFEAFTLAPMLSAYFFRPMRKVADDGADHTGRFYALLENLYRRALGWSLRHRWTVVLVGVATLVLSFGTMPLLGRSFISDFDRGELTINLEMPPGTTLDDMDRVAMEVEAILRQQPETASVFSTIGSADGAVEKASLKVMMKKRGQLETFQRHIRQPLAALPGVRYDIDLQANSLAGMMSSTASSVRGRPLQLNVQGSDFAALDRGSQQIADALKAIPGVVDVDRSLRPGKPEVDIKMDRSRAADLGITTAQLGATVRALVNGEVASQFRDAEREVDIVVRLQQSDRDHLAEIGRLPITTPRGSIVTLGSVAQLEPVNGPAQIERLDRQRDIVVGAGYMGRQLGEVYNDALASLAKLSLPAGVTYSVAGQSKYMEEAFSSLVSALLLAVLLIYIVLASQFGSFVHPFTIMLALPLSASGAILSLLATGKSLDMVAMIGIILLTGLVTKNSILLVDFVNTIRNRGMSRDEAVLAAGPIRLRPILMTTLAMIFGMLPTALGYGSGAEVRSPMAITVIGGLVTSTILTLLVVPVVYTLIDDLGRRMSRRHATASGAEPALSEKEAAPSVEEV